jgi:hypothetical protein
LATNKNGSNQVNSYTFKKNRTGISVPMQDSILFKAMKETHEQHKTKIDIDEFFTGTTNITLFTDTENMLIVISPHRSFGDTIPVPTVALV